MGRPAPLTVRYLGTVNCWRYSKSLLKIAELSVDADEDVDSGVNSAAGATSTEQQDSSKEGKGVAREEKRREM